MAKGGTTLRGRDRESWVPFLAARPTTPQEMDHGSRVEPAFGGTFTNSKRLANPCSSASGMAGFAGRDLAGQILSASGGCGASGAAEGLEGRFRASLRVPAGVLCARRSRVMGSAGAGGVSLRTTSTERSVGRQVRLFPSWRGIYSHRVAQLCVRSVAG
jgi:hypothetical protein